MRGENDRDAARLVFLHQFLDDRHSGRGIERRNGLIQYQEIWPRRQRSGDGEALLLSRREQPDRRFQ